MNAYTLSTVTTNGEGPGRGASVFGARTAAGAAQDPSAGRSAGPAGSSACPAPTSANSTVTPENSTPGEPMTSGAAAGGPSAIPALNAEPLADSSRGRCASDAPSTKYALFAGRYSAAPADTSSSAPTARTGLVSPGTNAAKPAVRSPSASSIARRSPIRPVTGPATTPPANWISEATASTKPTVPRPRPSRWCSSTDM